MFESYFRDLGFSEKEAQIFKALFTLGTQPASTVAKYLGMERTSVYKILTRLTGENLVYETNKSGMKHFFVPSIDVIQTYVENKSKKYDALEKRYSQIKQELTELENKKKSSLPKISLFDSNLGIQNIHQDIYELITKKKYISIKLFASNTIESQVNIQDTLKKSSLDLFYKLKDKNVNIETYLGNGIMLMENISKTFDIETISKIPASNSAINIYVVGNVIYILIFKETSFGIKIESDDLANTFHFLFENIETKK